MQDPSARIGGWLCPLSWQPLVLGAAVVVMGGCFPYGGDGAADMRAHRKLMQATSEQYERGNDLAKRPGVRKGPVSGLTLHTVDDRTSRET